jgi:hypothetical protein
MGKAEAYSAKRAYLMTMMDRMGAGARSRAAIIESLRQSAPKDKLALLDEDFAYYQQIGKYNDERLSIYTTRGKLKRLNKVLSLYLARSYQAFGRRGLMDSSLDLLYGVMD